MPHPIHVVLDNIRSAFNVGAFFRTSDAADIQKLWLGGITPYPPHNRIPKTALGATETVSWQHKSSTMEIIQELKNNSTKVYAVELTPNATTYTSVNYPKPCAVVFGNEINGVSEEILESADKHIKIPMFGQKESLNVEVSYGIIIYEIIRQWHKNSAAQ